LEPSAGGQRRVRQARRANAVVVAEDLLSRLKSVEGGLVPSDVNVAVTRDYGETANEKANELLFHLALATVSIVVLIAFAIGWREALVTLVVIPTTILLTLFASKTMGYTINRVSLFALIFAIGILVDDAIVVIENIARHWAMKDGRTRTNAAVEAVAEVGNPTVVATLTVAAALLPMLFVSSCTWDRRTSASSSIESQRLLERPCHGLRIFHSGRCETRWNEREHNWT
jgi:multidrug efflux pump subunit AcrB